MNFQWDATNIGHIARHEVIPAEVEEAFANNPVELSSYIRHGEERYAIAGVTDVGRVLFVVYTISGGCLRVVTAHESRKLRSLF